MTKAKEVLVLLAVNNHNNGRFENLLRALEIIDVCKLSGDPISCNIETNVLIVGECRYSISGSLRWVGNWCWDGVWMKSVDIARLLKQLRTKHWVCEEAAVPLYKAYDEGQSLLDVLTSVLG